MMAKDKLKKVAKEQAKKSDEAAVNLTIREVALLSLSDKQEETAYVNLKYYRHEHQCLSSWDEDQLKSFSAFCRKITQIGWKAIYKTAGAPGDKNGFGYTVHKNHAKLPANPDLGAVSPDLTWFELRVSGEARVHGFRCKEAFFLVFLDRQHEIYPG
jgi:hypothetical protein